MGFLIVAACALAGLLFGAGSSTLLGLLAGLAIGGAFAWLRGLSARLDAMRREIDTLGSIGARPAPPPAGQWRPLVATQAAPWTAPSAPVAPVWRPDPNAGGVHREAMAVSQDPWVEPAYPSPNPQDYHPAHDQFAAPTIYPSPNPADYHPAHSQVAPPPQPSADPKGRPNDGPGEWPQGVAAAPAWGALHLLPGSARTQPTQAPSSLPPSPPRAPHAADPLDLAVAAIKRWFTEGNVPVKIGVLVLFAGVAALLKYATDEGWLHVPIELRLSGVALAAFAALAFGWRERVARRSFALALQGGATGILLLVVFAAFRLYGLMPATAALVLLVSVVAGIGALALLQNAVALAVLGILAGFAAPILISTGSSSHVALFSYYAVLNLAIFAIAWVKPWRALNLLGFFFTFGISTVWGVLSYKSALFASTEPFLALNFAIYLVIPILYARRRPPTEPGIVDGTLVFGNPLIAFALQAALLDSERLPLAYSAVGLALIYGVLGWRLMPTRRLLGKSFAVLGVGFATLAVPLAFSGHVTTCTFALEGAALVWLGLRQRRGLQWSSGLALQGLAALAFVGAFAPSVGSLTTIDFFIVNPVCISALAIAGSAFMIAWLFHRESAWQPIATIAYLWGIGWWLGAGIHEIDHFVPDPQQLPAALGFAALTAALVAAASLRVRAVGLAWTIAVSVGIGTLIVPLFASDEVRPFAGFGLVAFAAYGAGGFFALRTLSSVDAWGRGGAVAFAAKLAQMGWLWTWTLAVMVTLDQLGDDAHLGSGWSAALNAFPLLAAWAVTLLRPGWLAPPMRGRFAEHRSALLYSQALMAGVGFVVTLWSAGDSAPAPFLPIVNPLELAQLGVLIVGARWLADRDAPSGLADWRHIGLFAAGFAFITAATLRATHHLGGVPWDDGLWSSNLTQTSLTVVWSVLGVLGWVYGSRRRQRMLWLSGAALMGVVLAKLLLVDRSHLGNLFGIVSFIAYGLLCTVIGYLAPAPPRAADAKSESTA